MNEVEVYELLKDKGYTDAQVAGIMGNIAVETGGSFDYRTEQRDGNGYGLFQFDFMKPYYFDYLKEKEIEDSPAAQVEFMHDTIYGDKQDIIGKGNAKVIRERLNTEYPEDVASVFMSEWEKPSIPHEGRRQGEAVKYFNFPPVKEEVVDLEATGFERSIK